MKHFWVIIEEIQNILPIDMENYGMIGLAEEIMPMGLKVKMIGVVSMQSWWVAQDYNIDRFLLSYWAQFA